MSTLRAAWPSALATALACLCFHASAQTTVAGTTAGSFRVTETGAATYSVPIAVTPGIGGIEPKLALAYNSQGRNGLLGLGWSLGGLSVVHRCGRTMVQDGASLGVGYDGNDRYCLDGQRLVAISGVYGADGTEYRTERESFTKIVSYGVAGSGPAFFKAWTKSGQVVEYGNTADSRIEAQGKASVRLYAVNKISDSAGNYLAWTYAEDNPNGDFYPTRVDYTGNGASLPFASARFSYQPRSDTQPLYVGGSVVRTMNRLINVKTYFGETAIRDYRLAYDNGGSSSASRLLSVTECSGDGTQCLSPVSLSWQASSGSTGYGNGPWGYGSWGSPAGVQFQASRAFVADANHDGLGDLFFANSWGQIKIAYSTGGGLSGPTMIATAPTLSDNTLTTVAVYAVGDVNGDGYADLVTGYGEVYLSNGAGFFYAGNWTDNFSESYFQFLVDVNGDGLADLIYASGTSIYVRYSSGAGFSAPSFITSDGSGCLGYVPDTTQCASPFPIFAAGDLNGDGRADVITGAGEVFLGAAGGFSYAGNWGVTFTTGHVADANGDGLGDLVYNQASLTSQAANTYVFVAYSNGAGFSGGAVGPTDQSGCLALDVSSGTYCYTPFALFAAGDMNGDGLADVFTGVGDMAGATIASPDLLAQVTDSLGATLSFTYAPLSNGSVYVPEGGAAWPVRDLRSGIPLYVASSASSTDGAGGTYSVNHKYIGGRVHVRGGGFLGFRRIESTDARTGLKTSAEFRRDYPFQGLPMLAEKTQPSGALLSRATNTWSDSLFLNTTGQHHRSDLTQAVETGNDLNGAVLPTVTTTTSYDGYGNALTIAVSTGDGYSKTTTSAYANDTSRWFLGRLSSSQVASAAPTASLTRSSSFAYDANTGLLTKEIIEPGNTDLCLVTEYQYDGYGNRISASTRNCNGSAGEAAAPVGTAVFQPRTSFTYFDTSAGCAAPPSYVPGRFAVRRVNAAGQAECLETDYRFGAPTKLTGPNGLATTWSYDLFGRKTAEARADGTTTTWTYALCGLSCPNGGKYSVATAATGAPATTAYFDLLNRAFRTETQGFDGTLVRKDAQFDNMGRVSQVSQPYFATQTPVWTTFTYDVLGRVLTQTDPNNSVTTTAYNGLTTTVTNALNQTRTSIRNSQGQLVRVISQ